MKVALNLRIKAMGSRLEIPAQLCATVKVYLSEWQESLFCLCSPHVLCLEWVQSWKNFGISAQDTVKHKWKDQLCAHDCVKNKWNGPRLISLQKPKVVNLGISTQALYWLYLKERRIWDGISFMPSKRNMVAGRVNGNSTIRTSFLLQEPRK